METSPGPTATAEESPAANGGDAGALSFADGATLLPGAEITFGDSLGSDPGWTTLPSDAPGRWTYANVEGTCTAAFRNGLLGAEPGMDDLEASDALIAAATRWKADDLAPLPTDGSFIRHGETDAHIEHRQASIRVDQAGVLSGSFVAARAFVAADHSVQLTVSCNGADIDVVAGEVLGKTVVQVVEP